MGKTPEGRGRRTENDRNGRPPWHERHGKDGRRHGEQKKKDGGKETPAKKNGDGARRKTGCGRRQRQKPRCVQDVDARTYRQVRPTSFFGLPELKAGKKRKWLFLFSVKTYIRIQEKLFKKSILCSIGKLGYSVYCCADSCRRSRNGSRRNGRC